MEQLESLTQLSEPEIKALEEVAKKVVNEIEITDGELEARTVTQLKNAVVAYRRAGLVPKQFETDAQAIGAWLYCKTLGVPPLQAWGQVACIHGKYTCFGSMFTALAKRDPDFGHDEVFFLNENMEKICFDNKNLKDPAWACVVRTQKKGSPFVNEFIFSMEDAQRAGIVRNVWKSYPKDMLYWKAIARSYKANYPAALNGVQMTEDLKQDWMPSSSEKEVNLNQI
ncbi:MAG TPA: hypothetical protein DCE71_07845 [Parachlamydiales bacterium]|nr:hypothetical protein [Parachlamydiales bacterium]